MTTGYTIRVGYISGYSYEGDYEEAWEALKTYAAGISHHPELIQGEASRYWTGNFPALEGVCKSYAFPTHKGNPLSIVEHEDIEECHIFISTSGSGDYRMAKEHAARAFCRLCMNEMHSDGIEVCINVA